MIRERIPQAELDRLMARVRLSDLVGQLVKWDRKSRPRVGDYWACCPFHEERTASFHVDDRRGRYHCFGCGASGNALKWLMEGCRRTFAEAVADLRGDKVKRASAPVVRQEAPPERPTPSKLALQIWREAGPLSKTLGEVYLHYRGLRTPPEGWPEVLRFHPGLEYFAQAEWEWDRRASMKVKARPGPKFPAIIASVIMPDGAHTGIWRIYLAPDGRGKAPVDSPKMGLGPTRRGAVRIGGVMPIIGACEGVETALAIRQLCQYSMPVWPLLGTGTMRVWEPPVSVHRVHIFPDGDLPKESRETGRFGEPAGSSAAAAIRERLGPERIVVEPEPAPGQDYLDILNRLEKVA